MSLDKDFPQHSALRSHVHLAGAERDVYTGEAIASALIASWHWLGKVARSFVASPRRSAQPLRR